MQLHIPRVRTTKEEKTRHPWKFLRSRKVNGAVELAYEVPVGLSFKDLMKQVDAIAATCGAPVEMEDRLGAVVIRIQHADFPTVIPFQREMLELTTGWTLLLGFDRALQPVTHDFRVPHGMFAGQSRYGKTQEIQFLMLQLIDRFSPEELEIRIIDMKQSSFRHWRGIPHITQIARNLESSVDVLEDAHQQMLDRGPAVWKSDGGAKFKTILVIIDEAAQIAPDQQSTKEDKSLAKRAWRAAGSLACVGAELGLGLWYCTQRPDATTINPQVKANMDMAVCFRTKTRSNSEIVLDHAGAEQLPQSVPGRAIYSTTGDMVFQAPYVGGAEEWETVLEAYKWEEAFEEYGSDGGDDEEGDEDGAAQEDSLAGVFGSAAAFVGAGGPVLDWRGFPAETSVRGAEGAGKRKAGRG